MSFLIKKKFHKKNPFQKPCITFLLVRALYRKIERERRKKNQLVAKNPSEFPLSPGNVISIRVSIIMFFESSLFSAASRLN